MTTTCLIGVAVGNVSSGPAACAAPVVIKAAAAVPSNSLRSDMTFPELLTERRASYGRRRRLSYEGIMTDAARAPVIASEAKQSRTWSIGALRRLQRDPCPTRLRHPAAQRAGLRAPPQSFETARQAAAVRHGQP